MGIINTTLYGNDTACDVRDTYLKYLYEQLDDNKAYSNVINDFGEYFGTEEEPIVWYALADTQWRLGRLCCQVKEKALEWINVNGGESMFEENTESLSKWRDTLRELQKTLNSPMPKPVKMKKEKPFVHNPWNTGDIYAYCFHTDMAAENNVFGKYILLQKIGEAEWYDGIVLSIICVYDCIFDKLPSLEAVGKLRVLPLVTSEIRKLKLTESQEDYERYFSKFLKAAMVYERKSQFPEKYVSFIGNNRVPKMHYHHSEYTELMWEKDMDSLLLECYSEWHNVDY